MDRALKFVRANASRPFFCYLPVTIPHAALQATPEDLAPLEGQFAEFDDAVGHYDGSEVRNPIKAFAAMVSRLDGDVGRLVALLEELDLTEKTLIIFSSDNGPHMEGGHSPTYFRSAGPLRGIKRDLYEGGLRVPTIACWPSQIPGGRQSDFASASWDWLPTLCDLLGLETPSQLDGVSLVPTLTGQGQQEEHDYLYWEFCNHGGKQALRRGDWKAIRLNIQLPDQLRTELYNIAEDPAESKELSQEHPEILAELLALMDQAHQPSKDFPLDVAQ